MDNIEVDFFKRAAVCVERAIMAAAAHPVCVAGGLQAAIKGADHRAACVDAAQSNEMCAISKVPYDANDTFETTSQDNLRNETIVNGPRPVCELPTKKESPHFTPSACPTLRQ